MFVEQAGLLAVAIALGVVAFSANPLSELTKPQLVAHSWVFGLAAWPVFVNYVIAPIIWSWAPRPDAIAAGLLYLPVSIYSLIVAIRLRRHVRFSAAAKLLAACLPISFCWALTEPGPITVAVPVAGLFLCAVCAQQATTSIAAEDLATACRNALAFLSAAFVIMAMFAPGNFLEPCNVNKCGALKLSTIASPAAHNGNFAAIVVVMLVPFALAGLNGRGRLLILSASGLLVIAAGGRTALFAWAFCIGLSLAVALNKVALRNGLLFACAIVAMGVSGAAALVPVSTSSFTGRGDLWAQARAFIVGHWVLGRGPQFWTQHVARDAAGVVPYAPHNTWLDIVLSVGIIGGLLIVASLVLQARRAHPDDTPWILGFVAVVFAVGTLESVYSPFTVSITPFTALLPLLLRGRGAQAPIERDDSRPATRSNRMRRTGIAGAMNLLPNSSSGGRPAESRIALRKMLTRSKPQAWQAVNYQEDSK